LTASASEADLFEVANDEHNALSIFELDTPSLAPVVAK
jgi:hypothetical protein